MENIFKNQLLTSAVIVAAGLALSGCGSSGGGTTVTSPNGIYTGAITGGDASSNGTEEKAIIYNNRMMVLSNNSNGVSQIFDFSLTDPAASLVGTGVRYSPFPSKLNDLSLDGTYQDGVSATANFTEQTTGTVTLSPGTFNLTENTALFDRGADLTRLSGTWTGIYDAGFGKVMTLVIDSSGVIDGANSIDSSGSSCGFSGAFSIVDATLNIYSINLVSDGGNMVIVCDLGAGTFSGLAWTEGNTNGALVLIAADGNKARAVVLTKN